MSASDDGLVLAIEMSQRGGSIALGMRGATPRTLVLASGTNDEDPLMPAIDELVRSIGAAPRDLSAIVVSAGPGGFTGLRIAITTSKCLADALSIPVVAVPSALVAACAAKGLGPRLVALASKRDTTWITATSGDDDAVRIIGTPGVVDASSFSVPPASAATAHFRTLLADEYVPREILAKALASGLAAESPQFDAAACWRVGTSMLARGEVCDPLLLAPIYPREPEAVTLWRERTRMQ